MTTMNARLTTASTPEHCSVSARAGRHPGDRSIPVADNGFLGQRHPQPLERRHLLRVRRAAAPQDDVHLRRRPSAGVRRAGQRHLAGRVVLVALGSCLTAGIASIAQHRKIQLRSVQATLEAERTSTGSWAPIPSP